MRPICVDNVIDCFASETEDLQGEIGKKKVSALPGGREPRVRVFTAVTVLRLRPPDIMQGLSTWRKPPTTGMAVGGSCAS